MSLVVSLYQREWERYIEPVGDELDKEEIDNMYNITTRREYYVNPTPYEELCWRGIYSYDIYLEDALDRW